MTKFVITSLDGKEVTATILPVDRVMFERQYGRSVGAIAKEEREEFFLWLAWHALKREGTVKTEFDDWLADVNDYSAEEEAPVPLDQAASPTP